jgi:hypothetical protein
MGKSRPAVIAVIAGIAGLAGLAELAEIVVLAELAELAGLVGVVKFMCKHCSFGNRQNLGNEPASLLRQYERREAYTADLAKKPLNKSDFR